MTDTQLYFAIGIPMLAVITSLIISLVQISGIREDMRELRKDTNASLNEMRKEAREDRLQIAADIKLLTGKVFELMAQK
jgi:uncharacterized membrane protein (DUF106 family)